MIINAKQKGMGKVKGLKLGIDDYITKPFSLAEVPAWIHVHLRRNRSDNFEIQDGKLEFKNGLTIKPEEKKMIFNNKEVQMASKKFDCFSLWLVTSTKCFKGRTVSAYRADYRHRRKQYSNYP